MRVGIVQRAKWVWRDRGLPFGAGGRIDPKLDANLYVLFRRAFVLEHLASRAETHVSADGRYKLYVNGTFVGRGPARCEPLFQYYDTYDIGPLLREGPNVVAMLAHSYGRDTSWYELPRTDWANAFGCGGIFVQCEITAGERQLAIDTDGSWRYTVSKSWEQDTLAGAVGFVEVFDARKDIQLWTERGFDDVDWEAAVVLETPGMNQAFQPPMVAFPFMTPRDIAPLRETSAQCEHVITVCEIAARDHDMFALAEAAPAPLEMCALKNPDALVADDDATEVHLAEGRALSVVLDFGGTVTGHPSFTIDSPADVRIDTSYSERLRDDSRVPVQRANPITSQNLHRYITRSGVQTWEKFDRAGFRYLQLTFSSPNDARIVLQRAGLTSVSYPVGERGAFACSDDTLTRIWRASAYTLQLCMQDGFEDCPSREQRQWVGDAYVEMLVNFSCFGDSKLSAKLVRQVAQSQRRDGMTQMATPGDVSARWPVYIVDYCLAWMMATEQYVMHTGDYSVVDDIFPALARAVGWFERYIDDRGLLVDPPGWIFIDWAEVDRRGACTALNALLTMALRHAATLAGYQKANRLARRWRSLAKRMSDGLNDLLWDERRGVYVDALLADGLSPRVSQQANAALIAEGIAPRSRWRRMLAYMMDESRLVETSTRLGGPTAAFDDERDVVLAQPFFMHVVHRALAAAGRHDEIVDNIRRRWLLMLGGSQRDTLWEHWHGEESRCHAWSATPAYDLSTEVLGVRPLQPGFERFAVQPALVGLSWAEGSYPSVRGDIRVAWQLEADQFSLELESPHGTAADVVLPPGVKKALLNGVPVVESGSRKIAALPAGHWRVEADLVWGSSLPVNPAGSAP